MCGSTAAYSDYWSATNVKTQHEYKPNFQKLILILEFKLKLFGLANVNFAKNIFVYIWGICGLTFSYFIGMCYYSSFPVILAIWLFF